MNQLKHFLRQDNNSRNMAYYNDDPNEIKEYNQQLIDNERYNPSRRSTKGQINVIADHQDNTFKISESSGNKHRIIRTGRFEYPEDVNNLIKNERRKHGNISVGELNKPIIKTKPTQPTIQNNWKWGWQSWDE